MGKTLPRMLAFGLQNTGWFHPVWPLQLGVYAEVFDDSTYLRMFLGLEKVNFVAGHGTAWSVTKRQEDKDN